jgi:glycosyltransferase involved in cell wall biosynthesis
VNQHLGSIRKFSIVTVCRNAERYIEETMRSVLEQDAVRHGRVELQYIVCDGGSTDRTVDLVRSMSTPAVQWISTADKGLYDSLSRALPQCTGDVVAYINAGDYFHKCAFDVVMQIMGSNPVGWLTGMTVIYNDHSQVIDCRYPFRYRSEFVRKGFYGRRLPFIEQESTFWRSELHGLVDFHRLGSLGHAGDAYLWHCFALQHELAVAQAQLGGFRIHAGQLSEDRAAYFAEVDQFAEPSTLWDRLRVRAERRLWRWTLKYRRRLNPTHYYFFDTRANRWRRRADSDPT